MQSFGVIKTDDWFSINDMEDLVLSLRQMITTKTGERDRERKRTGKG